MVLRKATFLEKSCRMGILGKIYIFLIWFSNVMKFKVKLINIESGWWGMSQTRCDKKPNFLFPKWPDYHRSVSSIICGSYLVLLIMQVCQLCLLCLFQSPCDLTNYHEEGLAWRQLTKRDDCRPHPTVAKWRYIYISKHTARLEYNPPRQQSLKPWSP